MRTRSPQASSCRNYGADGHARGSYSPARWRLRCRTGGCLSHLAALVIQRCGRCCGERGLGTGELGVLLAQARGNPLLASMIAELASRGEGLEQLLARLEPTTYSGLLGPDGRPLNPGEQPPESVGVQLRSANADLLARIRQDPDHVYSLSSREFEKLSQLSMRSTALRSN
jgi:hypothetical protein